MKHYARKRPGVNGSTPALRIIEIIEWDDQTHRGVWLDKDGVPLPSKIHDYSRISWASLEAFKDWIKYYPTYWVYAGTTLDEDLQVDEGL